MKKAIDKLTAAALSLSMLASLCPMAAASAEGDVLHWDFSEYTEEPVAAEGELTENYGGLEVHMNDGDVMTGGGLIWSAPGTTTSDDKTVANNRYIVFTPEVSGNISITFSGSIYNSKSKAPRMYIVPGEDPSCMSKTNSDANGSAATATGADRETVLTAELDAGETYYIWPYYYNSSECAFTVSDITYSAAVPEMKTRNIYESNMLLQRDEPVYIDGTCSAAVTEATVSLKNEDTQEIVDTVTADVEDREWSAVLDPVSDYESTYTLTISADGMEDIVYTNIIFGDQYLFSGQSNMWKQVSYYRNIDPDTYSESEVSKHLTDKIRVMYTPGQSDYGTAELQFDAQNKQPWRDFSSYANIRDISAVAYKTAVKLHEETGVPIGIIDNPYPGSYISSWFDSALAIDDCNLGKNGNSNERNWYCGRIYPIRNLKLSGIFWYQGCTDAATTYHDDPYTYYSDMMARLIDSWRELFGDGELPFYYTQLTRIGSTIVDENNPDTGAAGKMPIKLAQTDVYLNMEDKTNVGLVGTLDVYGAYEYPGTANDANCRNDIHCGQKQLVGDRMANLALIDIYGRESDSDGNKLYRMGPIYKSSRRSGSSVIVTFDCSGRLEIMPSERYTDEVGAQKIEDGEFDPNVLNEFELAGEDGVWYPAKAEITADNEVTVTSEDVSEPVMVRYANRDYSESPNLTDGSGLPSYVFSKTAETEEEPPAGTPTASPSAAPTAGPTASPDATPEAEKHTVTFDYGSGRTEKVTVADGDTVSELPEAPSKRVIELNENAEAGPAQLIRADYGDDGSLSKVSFTETTISDGQNELELPEADNEKYMLWDSMSGMRPLGIEKTKHAVWVANGIEFTADTPVTADVSVTAVYDHIASTTEPTAAPTAEPTGLPDYEETHSFDFGADRNEEGTFTVDHATAYGEHENGMTYGLINIDEASVIDDIRFDGFSDDVIAYMRDGEIGGNGYVTAPDAEPYAVSDEIVSKGWTPNESYPYPLPNEVTYEYPTIVKGIDINGGEVSSISVMVQGDMQYYALGAVDILGSDGSVLRTEYSVSTDINPLIGHIDNTACSYGEIYTMNFENVSVADGESVRAYTVALQSGEEVPTGERYSSYYVPEQTESVLMNEDFADGIDGWKEGGSSAVKETAAVQKDGKSAIKLSQNGSGTYNVYKRFDDNAEADNGIVRVRFMINYSYGSFTIKLSPATDTGSYVEGLKLIDVKDGVLSFEDGTEIGRIKTGKWTDVECRIDLINGTLTASVAGGTPKTIEKEELVSENESELDGLLPFRGFAAAYMATGSTIPSYSYETYISELVVDTVSCELPSYTVTAEAETGSEDRGTVSGGGKFDVNETATVNAKAADGYEFAGWYDELGNEISGLSEYSFRIRGDKKLYARFEEEVIDPNVTKWSFSAFRDGAEIFAESEESAEYNGLTIHVNGGDSVTEEGVYWNAPGGISSDSTTTVTNNRYIEFVPEKSGTISITYKGSLESGSNYPRMYISCGDSLACTTKDASAAQLEPNKQFDNKEGDGRYATMTADLTAGNHYYIWAYYYNRPGANFTISEISYDTNQK